MVLLYQEYRHGNYEKQSSLEDIYLKIRSYVCQLSPGFAPISISIIFWLSSVALVYMKTQAQSPYGYQNVYQYTTNVRSAIYKKSDPCQDYKSEAPSHISNIITFLYERNHEPEVHVDKQYKSQDYIIVHTPSLVAIK